MERVKIFHLIMTLALTFLAFVPKMESHIKPPAISLPPPPLHPLCATQLALVSYACAMLPFSPGSPLTPPLSPDDDDGEGHHRSRHNHNHGHRHRHSRHHRHFPEEDNCCRWAREMDSQCVCEILLQLPPFLTRPSHQYSVVIGESCNVTYSCGGPI